MPKYTLSEFEFSLPDNPTMGEVLGVIAHKEELEKTYGDKAHFAMVWALAAQKKGVITANFEVNADKTPFKLLNFIGAKVAAWQAEPFDIPNDLPSPPPMP